MHLEEYKLSEDLSVFDPIIKTDLTLDHGWQNCGWCLWQICFGLMAVCFFFFLSMRF